MSDKMLEQWQEWGSWEDAERWRKRDFRNRTPARRPDWLIAALELAYRSGAQATETGKIGEELLQ